MNTLSVKHEVLPGRLPSRQDPDAALGTHLVDWMSAEGLAFILSGEYESARLLFHSRTQLVPEDAEGWLGLGAAQLGEGQLKRSLYSLAMGAALAPEFPIGALVALVEPMPQGLRRIGDGLARMGTVATVRAATQVVDMALLASLGQPEIYSPIHRRREELQELLEQLREGRPARRFWRFAAVWFAGAALVGAFLWVAATYWQRVPSVVLVQVGTLDYVNAQRLQGTNMGDTEPGRMRAAALYGSALERFRSAAWLLPDSFEASFMRAKASRALLAFGGSRYQRAALVHEAQSAEASCRRLDPSGLRTTASEGALKKKLHSWPVTGL